MKPLTTVSLIFAVLMPVFPQETLPPTEDDITELRQKAEQGDREAQYNLGMAYLDGDGVSKDGEEYIRWIRLSAEQGYAAAQFLLGFEYKSEDDVEAVRWFRLAADQGDVNGQFALGYMYRNGWGVAQDDVQAYLWISLAASKWTFAVRHRDWLAEELTPEQIAEAERLVREWKAKEEAP